MIHLLPMHLTQFTDYSLRVLLFLAINPKELSTIDEISSCFKISRNHLVKVVHRLAQKGQIESFRGKRGGIRLARDPKTYQIGDLIRHTEPHMTLVECFDKKYNTCPISGVCVLGVALDKALQRFIDGLNKHTLADFIGANADTTRQSLLAL